MKLPMLLQNVNGKKFAHSLTHSLTTTAVVFKYIPNLSWIIGNSTK